MAMQTEVMHPGMATAWLECDPAEGSRPEKISLAALPFSVGRSQACSLTIDSHRVSREHAVIEQPGDRLVVRDLSSTNGTFVNGQRTDCAELNDGDVLVFADIEFNFHCPSQSPRGAVTEVLHCSETTADDSVAAWDLIREVRRMHEQTTQSASRIVFERVIELHSRATYGYRAVYDDTSGADDAVLRSIQSTECQVLTRLTRLVRAAAVGEARRMSDATHLFLPLESFELELEDLPASLDRLGRVAEGDTALVVEIHASAACDTPYFRRLLKSMRELGIAVAYNGFVGGPAQIREFGDITPDYLRLSKSTTDKITRDVNRQRQLRAVANAAADIDCDLIALNLREPDAAEVCRDLGVRFRCEVSVASRQESSRNPRTAPAT